MWLCPCSLLPGIATKGPGYFVIKNFTGIVSLGQFFMNINSRAYFYAGMAVGRD
eukprot:c46021_g1_i1 orf=3-161(-)